MRWGIVGLAIACAVGVGTLGYGQIATSMWDDAQDWRQQELAFLTSVHNRIEAELANRSGDRGAASLRREEHVILGAMAEVAKPMSGDRVLVDTRVVAPASDPPKEDALIEATSMERPVAPAAFVAGAASVAAPAEASAEAPSEPAFREAKASSRTPMPPLAVPAAGHTLPELESALNAEKTDRGLRVILPDGVFGTARAALDPAAEPLLSNLAQLIAAMQPREIVVIGPSGEDDADLAPSAKPALSKERAHAVAAWLAAHGSKNRAHFVERGNDGTQPVAPNNKADGSERPQEREQIYPIQILLRRH
jgi:flagellar motor protein MotB